MTTQLATKTELRDLAELLEVPIKQLSWYAWHAPEASRYRRFTLHKKSGALRQIDAPHSTLKLIQRRLLPYLTSLYESVGSRKLPVHGFVDRRSVVTNAHQHRNAAWVLNIDLKDFFPSITGRRVFGALVKPPYSLRPDLVRTIECICLNQAGHLPQGAPTSPVLSNIVARPLDHALIGLARMYHLRYSRYADDITFSGRNSEFPSEVARYPMALGTTQVVVGTGLQRRVEDNGFEINFEKCRLQNRWTRQCVTGVIVNNETINVPREYLRTIRRLLYHWDKFGLHAASTWYWEREKSGIVRSETPPEERFVRTLEGMIAYAKHVRASGRSDDQLISRLRSQYVALRQASDDQHH